jgi:hypothetical protein
VSLVSKVGAKNFLCTVMFENFEGTENGCHFLDEH